MNKKQAVELLNQSLKESSHLTANEVSNPTFVKWRRDTEVNLEHIFGKDTRHILEFNGISYTPMSFNLGESNDQLFYEAFHDGIDIARSILNSMIDEINKFWENEDIVESTEPITAAKVHEKSNKVFIVHGHDESAKQSVARLLEKLDLSPIILHEQPDKGKTIIEKFEEFSDVGFAVILLTPDDIGGIVGTKNDDLSERARQNVIFELGYFIGKIGRSRVCALHVGNVEILSDYSGVLFKKMGSGEEWKYQLGKELKAAGYGVDLNNI